MSDMKKSLENWLNDLNNFSFKSYEELPDINLYMDQIITYLEKQLYVFQLNTEDKQITPSMINNYVKQEILPSPISKKYSKEHLALIEEICTLKQVLTMAEVKQITDTRYQTTDSKCDTFNEFNELNNQKIDEAISYVFKNLNSIEDENDLAEFNKLAFDLALTANAYNIISKKILYLTRAYEELNKAKKKKKKDKVEEALDEIIDKESE